MVSSRMIVRAASGVLCHQPGASDKFYQWKAYYTDLSSAGLELEDHVRRQSLGIKLQAVPPGRGTLRRGHLAPKLRLPTAAGRLTVARRVTQHARRTGRARPT